MGSDLTEVHLEELLDFKNGQSSPDRIENGKFVVFGSNGPIGTADEINSPPETIVIGRVGSYCGSLHFSKNACWVTDNAIRATSKSTNDPSYLLYLLTTLGLHQWRGGSGQPLLNQRTLNSIRTSVHAPAEQRAIAKILRALDDKIDLNRRTNALLENMARAIFKAWFVDFEPVKAKAAGAASFPGMPPAVFEALPDSLVESELGEIPAGWEVKAIGELVTAQGGGTPNTKTPEFWEDGTYPFCTPKDMSKLGSTSLSATERRITEAGLAKISSGLLQAGTVLLSSRAPIGYLAITQMPLAVNQGIIAMTSSELPPSFILLWAEANMERIKSRAGGSTFAEISKTNFRTILALRPNSATVDAFNNVVEPLFELVAANVLQSSAVTRTRDLILPKLISGEIQVNDPPHEEER